MVQARQLIVAVVLLMASAVGLGAPAGATEVVSGVATPLALQVSAGQIVRFERPAGSIFVADPDVADVEVMTPSMVYVFGVQPGQTNLLAIDENDQVISNLQLSVHLPVDAVNQSIRAVSTDGAIRAEPAGNSMVLTGEAKTPVEAADAMRIASAFAPGGGVINRTTVAGPNQVNLRVRIAEVSRSTMRDLGINWQGIVRSGDFVFGLATGRDFINDAGQIILTGNNSLGVAGHSTENTDVNILLDAMEDAGFVSILAEPNLTAVSGQDASFLAGGEFPIIVPQDNGSNAVEFREFGVSLGFTPTIIGENRISMRVEPEVSELSELGAVSLGGFTVPSLTVRRAQTTVELASGQSFAIAGLFQRNMTDSVSALPVLSDLPVLGQLFRSQNYRSNESELVIIVTPYLVEPVSNNRMVSPTDPPRGLIDVPSPVGVPGVPGGTPRRSLPPVAVSEPIRLSGGFILK